MRPRDLVAGALEAVLPDDVRVIPYTRTLDGVPGPLVMVGIATVVPDPELPQSRRSYELEVAVMVATTTPGEADDDVDDVLEDVLAALDEDRNLTWTRAERATFAPSPNSPATIAGYSVTVNARVNITP